MPPKAAKPGSAKADKKAEAPPAPPDEDELLAKLAAKELEAQLAQEKMRQLAQAKEGLGAETFRLTTEIEQQRAKMTDINEYLSSELRANAARAAALEAQLAAAKEELEAAVKRTQEEVERSVARYKGDLAAKMAELGAANERLKAYDTFLAERDKLQGQLRALGEEVDELKKAHHKRVMDLERKHAQDRELWKRDSAAAVKAAREEMMALTDNRLEITTKRAVLENEQMSGELQYQSRQVQNLVQRNDGLQREVSELRVALDISRKGGEDLVRKNHVLEKTVEALLCRLEQQDAERAGEEGALAAEYGLRVAGLEEEVHMAVLSLGEREREVAELRGELARRELQSARAGSGGLLLFLERCLEDAQQQLAAPGEAGVGADAEPYELPWEQRGQLLRGLLHQLRCEADGQHLLESLLPSASRQL